MSDKTHPHSLQNEFVERSMEFLPQLYGHALNLSKNQANAKDLIQETMLKAFKAYGSQFKRGTNLKAWLFTILRNTFINQYRKNVRSPEQVELDEGKEFSFYHKAHSQFKENPQTFITPKKWDRDQLDSVFGDEVVKAMELLPDEYRETVYLCDVQDFSYQEIADIMNIPIGTVRSRLARGRGLLNKTLWEYAVKNGILKRTQ